MQSKQVNFEGSQIAGGENAANFIYKRSFTAAQEVFAHYKFGAVKSRDDLKKALDAACGELQH